MLRFVAVETTTYIALYIMPFRSDQFWHTAPTKMPHTASAWENENIWVRKFAHTHADGYSRKCAMHKSDNVHAHTNMPARIQKHSEFCWWNLWCATQWRCRQQRKQLFFNVGLLDPGSWAYGTHTHAHTHAHARTSNIMNTSQASGGEVVRRGNPFRTNW